MMIRFVLGSFVSGMLLVGQCAMCFRTAEAQNRARANVLNTGIAVMVAPLVAMGVLIGRMAYQRRRA